VLKGTGCRAQCFFPASHLRNFFLSHLLTFSLSHRLFFPPSHLLNFSSSLFPAVRPSLYHCAFKPFRAGINPAATLKGIRNRIQGAKSHRLTRAIFSHLLTFAPSHRLFFPPSHLLNFSSSLFPAARPSLYHCAFKPFRAGINPAATSKGIRSRIQGAKRHRLPRAIFFPPSQLLIFSPSLFPAVRPSLFPCAFKPFRAGINPAATLKGIRN
jgi:hypothetical protein